MRQEDFTIPGVPSGYTVWDVDVTQEGDTACVLAAPANGNSGLPPASPSPQLLTRDGVFSLPPGSLWPMMDGKFVRPPNLRFAGKDRIVVYRALVHKDEANAWVVSQRGEVGAAFHAGDGIEELLANEHFIVVTYFDEGIFSGNEISAEGLAVFDLTGQFLHGYASATHDSIADCYCACWSSETDVTFYPYEGTNFQLVRWNIADLTQERWSTPAPLYGSRALTTSGDKIYFHSPYSSSGYQGEILEWAIGSEDFSSLGAGPAQAGLRGLLGGRFITTKPNGYAMITLRDS